MVFMTDDSAAEKSSLSAVWPNARQLLCHFHVVQAMWRWLFTNIDKNDRQFLMKLFQNVCIFHVTLFFMFLKL